MQALVQESTSDGAGIMRDYWVIFRERICRSSRLRDFGGSNTGGSEVCRVFKW